MFIGSIKVINATGAVYGSWFESIVAQLAQLFFDTSAGYIVGHLFGATYPYSLIPLALLGAYYNAKACNRAEQVGVKHGVYIELRGTTLQ